MLRVISIRFSSYAKLIPSLITPLFDILEDLKVAKQYLAMVTCLAIPLVLSLLFNQALLE